MKRKATAKAKGATFDIEVTAVINTKKVLSSEETLEIQKDFKQRLCDSISKLPYAHIYSHEVQIR